MAHLITFHTPRFDPEKEPENPINPIPGHGVLEWLKPRLAAEGVESSSIEPEDWGWYIEVEDGAKYLVGAAGDGDGQSIVWMIQVEKLRSLGEKLLGKNKLADDDKLSARIERLVRAESDFERISVDKDA